MERRKPEVVFPEELWIAIFSKLEDAHDLLHCCATTQLWKSLLYNKRPFWIFPTIFPKLFQFLPKQAILALQRVCKTWNHRIVKFLENEQPMLKITSRRKDQRTRGLEVDINFTAKQLGMNLSQALNLFDSHFGKTTDINPFISRSLSIYIDELKHEYLWWFEKYGKHLNSLSIYLIQDFQIRLTPWYSFVVAQYIWHLLAIVPNLKRLKLWAINQVHLAGYREIKPTAVQKHQLSNFLEQNPVPDLPQLHLLEIFMIYPDIQNKLETHYASQLVLLKHDRFHPTICQNLPNVKELEWRIQDIGYDCVEILRSINVPLLQRLEISTSPGAIECQDYEQPCAPILFEIVERFQTLRSLTLCWGFWGTHFPPQLNLPNLNELTLEIFGNSKECRDDEFSLCFLGTLKKLSKFTFLCDLPQYDRITEVSPFCTKHIQKCCHVVSAWKSVPVGECVDLKGYLDSPKEIYGTMPDLPKPYQSNVWRLLPLLQTVVVGIVKDEYIQLTPNFVGKILRWPKFQSARIRTRTYTRKIFLT